MKYISAVIEWVVFLVVLVVALPLVIVVWYTRIVWWALDALTLPARRIIRR